MDAMVGTGAAALMAIRVLLDHEVPEVSFFFFFLVRRDFFTNLGYKERIIFVTFLAAQIGLTVITNAFPRVKIVTSMVDPSLNKETLWIEPGIGNFGGKLFLVVHFLSSLNLILF